MSHSLGIDCTVEAKYELMIELAWQREITSIQDGGEYSEDPDYTEVHVETTWSESELDRWLCNNSQAEWLGVFSR